MHTYHFSDFLNRRSANPFFFEGFFKEVEVLVFNGGGGFSSNEAKTVFSTVGKLVKAFFRSSCRGNARPWPCWSSTDVYDEKWSQESVSYFFMIQTCAISDITVTDTAAHVYITRNF